MKTFKWAMYVAAAISLAPYACTPLDYIEPLKWKTTFVDLGSSIQGSPKTITDSAYSITLNVNGPPDTIFGKKEQIFSITINPFTGAPSSIYRKINDSFYIIMSIGESETLEKVEIVYFKSKDISKGIISYPRKYSYHIKSNSYFQKTVDVIEENFDSTFSIQSSSTWDPISQIESKTVYFPIQNRQRRTELYVANNFVSETKIDYDARGLPIGEKIIASGTTIPPIKKTYEYKEPDAQGNWRKKYTYGNDDKLEQVIERTITY